MVERQEENLAVKGYASLDRTGLFWDATTANLIPMARQGNMAVTVMGEDGVAYDLRLENRHLKVKCSLDRGEPRFRLEVQLEANLVSVSPSAQKRTDVTQQAARALERRAIQDYTFAIQNFTMEGGVDFLSLGKYFSFQYPAKWEIFSKNWENYLKKLDCEIVASAKVLDQRGVVD